MTPIEFLLALTTSNTTLLAVCLTNIAATAATMSAYMTCLHHYRSNNRLITPAINAIQLLSIAAMAGSFVTILTALSAAALNNAETSGEQISVLCTAAFAAITTTLFYKELRELRTPPNPDILHKRTKP